MKSIRLFRFPTGLTRLTGLALAIGALIFTAALTGCKMTPEERASKATSYVSDKLDLNETQRADFKRLADLAVVDFKAMSASRQELAGEIEKQALVEKADTTAIKKLVAAQHTKRLEISNIWTDRIAEFHSKLSPEQKQKALKLMQKFREKFESRSED